MGKGERLLLEQTPEVDKAALALDESLREGETNKQQRIANYLQFLVDVVGDPALSRRPSRDSMDRLISTHTLDITDSKVRQSYLRFRDRGNERLGLDPYSEMVDEEQLQTALEGLVEQQAADLTGWLRIINDPDAGYPTWFRYYAFEGVKKLAAYDPGRKQFKKRQDESFDSFPEPDGSTLAIVYSAIQAELGSTPYEGPVSKRVRATKSFRRIFSEAFTSQREITEELLQIHEGSWRRFSGVDDAVPLSRSLSVYHTGWCTSGEGIAKDQLSNGDFFVFYSANDEGVHAVPRLAIRMEEGVIAEVRGVEPGQHVEPAMLETLEGFASDLPGWEAYKIKVEDSQKVTELMRRLETEEPTTEDLRFIWQIDRTVRSFGYSVDSRLQKVMDSRDFKSDIRKIYEGKSDHEIVQELLQANSDMMYQEDMMLEGDLPMLIEFALSADFCRREMLLAAAKKGFITDIAKQVQSADEALDLIQDMLGSGVPFSEDQFARIIDKYTDSKPVSVELAVAAFKAGKDYMFDNLGLKLPLLDTEMYIELLSDPNIDKLRDDWEKHIQDILSDERIDRHYSGSTGISDLERVYENSLSQDQDAVGNGGATFSEVVTRTLTPEELDARLGRRSRK